VETVEFAWTWLALPYVVLGVALLGLGAIAMVVRGDSVLRLAMIAVVASTMPFAVTYATAACARDPAAALRLIRVGAGPLSLIGPSLLLLILATAGQVDRHRRLAIGAAALGTASMVMCWTTPWVVPAVRPIASGLYYNVAGVGNLFHVGQIPLWAIVGVVLARRASVAARVQLRMRHIVAIAILAAVATSDTLLAHGVVNFYPVSWVPALIASGLAYHLVLRADLLRARGFDRHGAVDLVLLVVATVVVALVVAVLRTDAQPLVIAAATAPAPVFALAMGLMRQRAATPEVVADDAAVARFHDAVSGARDLPAIAAAVRASWKAAAELDDIRIWRDNGAGRLEDDAGQSVSVGDNVRRWLIAYPSLLVVDDLATMPLRAVRGGVEAVVASCGPDVILPLVDREELLGVIGARRSDPRALRDPQRALLQQTGVPAARALAFVGLRREAEAAARSEREVEIGDAIATQAGTRRGASLGDWQLVTAYRAAERVAGDVWAWERMPDGRLALLIADVAGRGVPAALMSSALAGAFTAGAAVATAPAAIAALLDDIVGALGQKQRGAAAFVAVCDGVRGTIEWASAGHRGATVIRRGAEPDAEPVVELLSGKSDALGSDSHTFASGATTIGTGELLVVVSDGVIDLRDKKGQSWGERRFGQILHGGALDAGDPASLILDAALAHAGGERPTDDLLVITARRTGEPRVRASSSS
jgi:serine phosphatase RsbU (regulator of sigma subunit)